MKLNGERVKAFPSKAIEHLCAGNHNKDDKRCIAILRVEPWYN